MRDVETFREYAVKKLNSRRTKHELIFQSVLEKNFIKFESNKLIKRYIVDFYFPDTNIIIELDGYQH